MYTSTGVARVSSLLVMWSVTFTKSCCLIPEPLHALNHTQTWRENEAKSCKKKKLFQPLLCQTSCFCDFLRTDVCVDAIKTPDYQRAPAHWEDSHSTVEKVDRIQDFTGKSCLHFMFTLKVVSLRLCCCSPCTAFLMYKNFVPLCFACTFLQCQNILLCKYLVFINFTLIFGCIVYNFPFNKIPLLLL